jgi:hypothetical protein
MIENRITFVLYPETYNYADGDIVYRIIGNHQLLTERAIPCLNNNQALAEKYIFLAAPDNIIDFRIINLKSKKIKLSKVVINDVKIDLSEEYTHVNINHKDGNFIIQT